MEATISKAQYEVWEMKEAVYEKIKDIPKNKRIELILKSAEETVNQILEYKRLKDKSKIN
ncbi:MAG: hypothetical protein V1779_10085 [bacterium]